MHTLTFAQLRAANIARLPEFKNKHGEPAHVMPDGSDWSPAQWFQALVGELGEYANIRKKFERRDITPAEFIEHAQKELADAQTYLDLLAFRLGIDLGEVTARKFNEVSERVGSAVYLDEPADRGTIKAILEAVETEQAHCLRVLQGALLHDEYGHLVFGDPDEEGNNEDERTREEWRFILTVDGEVYKGTSLVDVAHQYESNSRPDNL